VSFGVKNLCISMGCDQSLFACGSRRGLHLFHRHDGRASFSQIATDRDNELVRPVPHANPNSQLASRTGNGDCLRGPALGPILIATKDMPISGDRTPGNSEANSLSD
jgi:hypothetical protein